MTAAHHGKAFHGGEHYENFPVGSWLVPGPIRVSVLALYRFARTGDDIADEGSEKSGDRIRQLHALLDGLRRTPNNEHPELAAIGQTLRAELDRHAVSIAPAEDLITAFLQDAAHTPMQHDADVLAYCTCSANPIGRLLLALAGVLNDATAANEITAASDAICTGLQLANFAQDMGQDVGRDRIYIPAAWLSEMGLAHASAANALARADLASRMARWAQSHLEGGSALPRMIRKSAAAHRLRFALEVALALEGGREICRQVLANPEGVWTSSPSISKARLAVLVLRALRTL